MEEPAFILGGIGFYSPMSALTDYLLTVQAICFAVLLGRDGVRFWRGFFFASALATFLLGSAFALKHFEAGHPELFRVAWFVAQLATVVTCYYAQRAALFDMRPESRTWEKVVLLQLALFIVAVLWAGNFAVVYVDSFISLSFVMFLYSRGGRGGRLITLGVLIWFSSLVLFFLRIRLHRHFNHLDLAHVVMLVAYNFMFAGARSRERT